MAKNGQDNLPYAYSGAIDRLGDLLEALASAYSKPKPPSKSNAKSAPLGVSKDGKK